MNLQVKRCVNCGAVLKSKKCEYCDTVYTDEKPVFHEKDI